MRAGSDEKDTGTANPLVFIRDGSRRFIIYLTVLILLLASVWVLASYLISQERRKALDAAVDKANGIATFFESHAANSFRYADDYIRTVRRIYLRSGSLEAVRRYMAQIPPDSSTLSHITIMGADGVPRLIFDGLDDRKIRPGINARDRDYFVTQKASTSDGMVISVARKGRNTGLVTVRIVRRLTGPQGDFQGVIFAAVKATQLLAFFEATRVGPDSTATLVGLDKVIRLRSPAIARGKNRRLEKSKLWALLRESARGIYHQTSIVDGIPRFWSYRKVAGFPVVAVIGTAIPNLDAAFAGTVRGYYGIAGLVSAVIIVLALFALRETVTAARAAEGYDRQKRGEEALRASERRYRHLAKVSPEGIIVHTDGKIVFANPEIVSMLHADGAEQLIGTETIDLIHPDDRAGVLQRRRQVAEDGRSDLEQARFLCFDGSTIHVERLGTKVDWEGQPSILLIMRDVTDQFRAREQLRLSEERYRLLVEALPDANLVTDTDGIIVFANSAAADLFAAESVDRLVGMNVMELVHADDRADVEARRRRALQGKQQPFAQRRRLRLDGSEFDSESHGIPFTWNGEAAILIVIRDITEKIKFEAAQRENERTNREISELIPAAYIIQSAGKIVFANAQADQMFGVTEELKLIGADGLSIVDETFREHVLERRERVEQSGRPSKIERTRHRTLDGTVMDTQSIAGPFTWQDKPATINIIVDQTEVQRLEAQLRQAQKMEAIGQLTGGVAHDFNNLLMVIQGNAELLMGGSDQDDKKARAIQRASRRGAELTHRLLAFSRQQPLNPQTIDMADLLESMSDLLVRTLGATIDIEIKPATDPWPALADPGQLENALLNLSINARDAMPRGGKLTIECSNVHLDGDHFADDKGAVVGDFVVLAVSDTGIGMSDHVLSHAFEPFFTTKEIGMGSGLGLSMIYGFAKQSGGLVNIYSEEGKGTTVRLYLPRGKDDGEREISATPSAMPRGRGETILVIEDDDDVRALASEMLVGLGYRVVAVPAVKQARHAMETEEQVDLVLSDVVLPGGVSGPEFADELAKDHPRLKVVFMSGYPAEAAKRNGFVGSDRVLVNKPFQRHVLAQAVRDALD